MKLEISTPILEELITTLESQGLLVHSIETDHTEDVYKDYELKEKGLNRLVIKVYQNKEFGMSETKQIFTNVLDGFGFDTKIDDDIIADKDWIGYRMELYKKTLHNSEGLSN